MGCLLSFDIGSSSAKAGVFDEHGQAFAVAARSYPTADPRPGYKEQDPEDWWSAVCEAIREVLRKAPAAEILAVGSTGHISSLTFLDSQGRVMRPSLGFQDQRAVAEVQELGQRFSRSELAAFLDIDLPPAATWPLPRMLWVSKHEPRVLQESRSLLQAKDFVNFRLTGEIASDASSNRGLVDLAQQRPAQKLFDAFGLPNLIPPLRLPQEVIGRVTKQAASATGLPQGVPVVAGWNDLNACVLGSGVVARGQAFAVTGTSDHVGLVVDERISRPELICGPYLPGRRLFYGVTSTGGGSLQWFSRLCGRPVEELLALATGSRAELLFLPYLEGERSPIWDPYASGALLGLSSAHGPGEVARAVLEGVAFSSRQILELVEEGSGLTAERLLASGGAAKVGVWNRIKANVLGKEIATLRNPDAGVQGAAILAAVAAGLYPDPESAARGMVGPGESYLPEAAAQARRERLYALYCGAYPTLRGIMHRLREETVFAGGAAEETKQTGEKKAMTKPHAVVFGAGKIARGFLAHLLTLSEYDITFVEKNSGLVAALRERGRYSVQVLGAPEKSISIAGFAVLHTSETARISAAVAEAAVVFISIGGPNLPEVAPLIAGGLEKRAREKHDKLNVILGENYFQPARWLRSLLLESLPPSLTDWFEREVGVVETMILRSCIEPTEAMKAEDPLSLKVQDMWELPADGDAFAGAAPPIRGLAPQKNFQGGLTRKLFTYNCINAVIAYGGFLKGYKLLGDAAHDPELLELARAAYRESSEALCLRYGFDRKEQEEFAEAAIAKYQKREIVDPIERNARDPARKLARNDRLIGPACLALDYGTQPIALSRAAAAAFLYDSANDPSAPALQERIRAQGIHAVIPEVCGIAGSSELALRIAADYEGWKNRGR